MKGPIICNLGEGKNLSEYMTREIGLTCQKRTEATYTTTFDDPLPFKLIHTNHRTDLK